MIEYGISAILEKPFGEFLLKEYPIPNPASGTLIIKVELCGICGADVQIFQGLHHHVNFPIALGHEICGEIVAVGDGKESDFTGKSIAIGDRIVFVPSVHCGQCYFCSVAKTRAKCLNATVYGFLSDKEEEPHFKGGYGQYLYIHDPRTSIFKTNVPAEAAALTEPLAVALHGVERSGLQAGDTAVVQGAGPLGLLMTVACKASGASTVIVVGKSRKERLALAAELGADIIIDMKETPQVSERRRIVEDASSSGFGADVVFECAGAPQAFSEGVQYVRDSGIYCIVGSAVDKGTVSLNPCMDILDKNITIHGIYDHDVEHFSRAFRIIEERRFAVSKVISHRVSLGRLHEAMSCYARQEKFDGYHFRKAVVDPWL